MTINVALVTGDAVVLGCDSIASSTQLFLNPLPYLDKDANGDFSQDDEGRMVARFGFNDLQHVVTDAWGGVTKMFELCGAGQNPCAAVTAGMASLNGRNIASIAGQFRGLAAPGGQYGSIEAVANAFVEHVGAQYDAHYAATGDPPEFRNDVEFLIGGFGQGDNFPSLFRVNLVHPADTRISKVYGTGEGFSSRTGVAWAGQADGIERVLFGYDRPLRAAIEREITEKLDSLHQSMSGAVISILAQVLSALNAQLPEGLNTELPPREEIVLDWDQLRANIDFPNLPIQDAVDLVAFLVNLQSGKAKFVRGVPTVGGRTHVGIVSRQGFRMLNEPELVHRNVGYARDI